MKPPRFAIYFDDAVTVGCMYLSLHSAVNSHPGHATDWRSRIDPRPLLFQLIHKSLSDWQSVALCFHTNTRNAIIRHISRHCERMSGRHLCVLCNSSCFYQVSFNSIIHAMSVAKQVLRATLFSLLAGFLCFNIAVDASDRVVPFNGRVWCQARRDHVFVYDRCVCKVRSHQALCVVRASSMKFFDASL